MKLFRCILLCTLAICNGTTKLSCASSFAHRAKKGVGTRLIASHGWCSFPDTFASWLTRYQRRQRHAQALPPPGRPQGSPPRSTPPPPLLCDVASDDLFVLIVRVGAVWSGVGTLAVALGGIATSVLPDTSSTMW